MAEVEVDWIMEVADADQNGYLEYNEWLAASIDKGSLFNEQKLKAAFWAFDKDDSGSISIDEIKRVLGVGEAVKEEVWEEILEEVDENGDGTIDYDEFKTMMMKLLAEDES